MRDLISFLIDLFSFDKEHPLLFTQFNFWAFFLLVFAGFCLIQRSCRKGRLAGKDNKRHVVLCGGTGCLSSHSAP